MICLTSDIHHSSLCTGNQQHCDLPEIQVARRSLELIEKAGIKTTFFISGKSFVEEWEDLKPICRHPLVEVGGHNYSCFQPELLHRVWNRLLGSYNGPAWVQRRDAQRTIDIIRRRTGRTIRSWRNHMYMHGPYTEEVLSRCGLQVCSDGVRKNTAGFEWHSTGLLNLPINVIPDHEHLYHAERTPEWVERWVRRYGWSDDFGSQSYFIRDWTEVVLERLRQNEESGVLSVMIVHPITMYLCDQFASFQKILDFITDRETLHVSEVHSLAANGRAANRTVRAA